MNMTSSERPSTTILTMSQTIRHGEIFGRLSAHSWASINETHSFKHSTSTNQQRKLVSDASSLEKMTAHTARSKQMTTQLDRLTSRQPATTLPFGSTMENLQFTQCTSILAT
jgi:N-acetylmuramoyl-L-alanine amidase CwlA